MEEKEKALEKEVEETLQEIFEKDGNPEEKLNELLKKLEEEE